MAGPYRDTVAGVWSRSLPSAIEYDRLGCTFASPSSACANCASVLRGDNDTAQRRGRAASTGTGWRTIAVAVQAKGRSRACAPTPTSNLNPFAIESARQTPQTPWRPRHVRPSRVVLRGDVMTKAPGAIGQEVELERRAA